VEAKNAITEQIESDNLHPSLTTASHTTSHTGLRGNSSRSSSHIEV